MIGRVYQLMDTKRIEMKQREIEIFSNTVLVRPEYMAICTADQRYYLGQRKKEILSRKLPMALIHEATGTVMHDFNGILQAGTKVVLIPLEENGSYDSEIKSNYRMDSKFASSGTDGFMRDIIAIQSNRILPIDGGYSDIYVFTEILSVALAAIEAFEAVRRIPADPIGIWGDGSMGFITALALRCRYPQSDIYVFGKSARKLSKFSFVTQRYFIDNIPDRIKIRHAFECVGGAKSENALKQIIRLISPQGTINLLGVSEDSISIETRKVLDKGLMLIGHSRSDRNDFIAAAGMIRRNEICKRYISLLISQTIPIKSEKDIATWFQQDLLNDFKTLGVWQI